MMLMMLFHLEQIHHCQNNPELLHDTKMHQEHPEQVIYKQVIDYHLQNSTTFFIAHLSPF